MVERTPTPTPSPELPVLTRVGQDAPLHVLLRLDPDLRLEVYDHELYTDTDKDYPVIEPEQLAAWSSGRPIALWVPDPETPYSALRRIIEPLLTADQAPASIFFITPGPMECFHQYVQAKLNGGTSEMSCRGVWATTARMVHREELGWARLPRLQLSIEEMTESTSNEEVDMLDPVVEVDELRAALDEHPSKTVIVGADAAVELRRVQQVLDKARQAGASRLLLLIDGHTGLLLQTTEPDWFLLSAERLVERQKPRPVPIPGGLDHPEPIFDDTAMGVEVALPPTPIPTPTPERPIYYVAGGPIPEPVLVAGERQAPYSKEALQARLTGSVILELTIGRDGSVTRINVLHGLPLGLTESAMNTARKWRFKPIAVDDTPIELIYPVTIHFDAD